ncbi:TonB-dependent receptor [Pedobacter duraquae]|uniref:Outer membrane receptor protein involved in Fe transport n=1 Tax=Pedobacter duraquae TaxID=425511 RepID=A0A4R6IBH3_9SPHI|nr:TonB-dependent receptor [Pedobacter duraquae]TDO19550.1 outer membrane receptor protein involved in Fe transport [Pedobacter duraquae]
MLRTFKILLLLCVGYSASAQIAVTGKITTDKQTPVELAVVSILQRSVVVSNTISDHNGIYQFKDIKPGIYQLLFKHVSFRDTVIAIALRRDTVLNVSLSNTLALNEVTVRAKRPIFQKEIDRLRFNVAETDLVFGNNIWDVVEKTPLVTTSSDGGIQISGTSGAVVYMNGKKKILSGGALKNYLSSLPSDNLEAIEVITTPSSKYDAEGGAGIINIITKKNKEEGFIGNSVLSMRQTAVNSEAGSVYLNQRKGKWNIFSDAFMGNRSRNPEFRKDIYYPVSANQDLLHRNIISKNAFQILYPGANLGIDHEIDRNQVVGLLFDYSGSWQKETRDALSTDDLRIGKALSLTNNRDRLNSQTYALNLNYQGKLDSAGKKLSVDFDALEYRSANNSVSKTEGLDLINQQPIQTNDWFRSASPQNISNQSLKFDFEWPLNKNTSVDFGAKASMSRINNDLLFENTVNGAAWTKDNNRSNLFKYNENINSLYGILHHKLSAHWAYQLGLRLENTNAQGWLDGEMAVDKNYVNLFPTAFLKYTSSKDQSYVLAVSSRITRPGFWDVNPFRTYTSDQTYYEGNPFLSPSKYYRQELSHTISGKTGSYTIQLAASQSLDEIFALPYNPAANIIANKKVNYGNKYGFTGSVAYYKQLLPWWRLSGTALTGYVATKGAYAGNVLIDNSTFLLSISANQTFSVSKKDGLSCTLITSNTFPNTIVNTHIGNRLETEVRLRKSVGAFNVTLSVQDWFKSNKDRYRVSVDDLRIFDENYYDTRSVAIALSFNFGKSTVKDKRDRETGAKDVKQRMI